MKNIAERKIMKHRKIFALLATTLLVSTVITAFSSCEQAEKSPAETAHTHTFSTTWTSDNVCHWHAATCEHTTEVSGKSAHSYVNGTCSVCGKKESGTNSLSPSAPHTHTYVNGVCSVCGKAKPTSSEKFSEGLEYNLSSKSCTVTGIGSCKSSDIIIPSTYNDLPVTRIANKAFYCESITSVTIPGSVSSIGTEAFYNCNSLTSVKFLGSTTTIEKSAFNKCSALSSLNLPEGLSEIESYAFAECTKISSITIPKSMKKWGVGIFEDCTGLKSLTIAEGVTYIGQTAFSGCTGLKSVTIPKTITLIKGWAFDDCVGLISLTIPEKVSSIDSSAFRGCTGLTSLTIPKSVTTIGDGAFWECTGLTSVRIPKTTKFNTSINTFMQRPSFPDNCPIIYY